MAAFIAFVGMLLLSLVAALIAAFQLADFFGAGDEFVLVIGCISAFSLIAMTAFAVGSRYAQSLRLLNVLAVGLALIALLGVALPGLPQGIAGSAASPATAGSGIGVIGLELLIPALVVVLVQWGLVRSRWLRGVGEEELTLWPWVTTVVAGLVILNPFGLAVGSAAVRPSPIDPMWQTEVISSASVLAALLVMAFIEYYIRERILRRRLADGVPAGSGVEPD
jgi:hypothetical protein